MKKYILPVCCFLVFQGIFPGACPGKTVILHLNFRLARETLPVVENMLSPEGRASADARTNSLVVTDTPERIDGIRTFLSEYDRPARQVMITVRFSESGADRRQRVSGDARISGKDWTAVIGKKRKDGVRVRVEDREQRRERTSEYFIHTLSGSEAYIVTGKEVPYTERWRYLCGRYACYEEVTDLRRIETGMVVTPVVLEDRALLEITPQIARQVPGRKKDTVRFTKASTRLSVPFGRWVEIGGADQSANEVVREILSRGGDEGKSSVSIFLKVEPVGR